MTFFEFRHPDYDARKIEDEVLKTLKKKGIPLEQESEFVEKYSLEIARRELLANPINRLKIMIFKTPPWLTKIAKRFPFYRPIRRKLEVMRVLLFF